MLILWGMDDCDNIQIHIIILLLTITSDYKTEDANEGKIPTGFPENVLMVRQNYEVSGQSKYILHNNYRRKDTKEFHYFATRILPCVNARHTNYKAKCGIKMLSQVLTESDEAYA